MPRRKSAHNSGFTHGTCLYRSMRPLNGGSAGRGAHSGGPLNGGSAGRGAHSGGLIECRAQVILSVIVSQRALFRIAIVTERHVERVGQRSPASEFSLVGEFSLPLIRAEARKLCLEVSDLSFQRMIGLPVPLKSAGFPNGGNGYWLRYRSLDVRHHHRIAVRSNFDLRHVRSWDGEVTINAVSRGSQVDSRFQLFRGKPEDGIELCFLCHGSSCCC